MTSLVSDFITIFFLPSHPISKHSQIITWKSDINGNEGTLSTTFYRRFITVCEAHAVVGFPECSFCGRFNFTFWRRDHFYTANNYLLKIVYKKEEEEGWWQIRFIGNADSIHARSKRQIKLMILWLLSNFVEHRNCWIDNFFEWLIEHIVQAYLNLKKYFKFV